MHGQTFHVVRLAVHFEGQQTPATFGWPYVACIYELLHFVAHNDFDGSTIMAFMHIFVQVLDGSN